VKRPISTILVASVIALGAQHSSSARSFGDFLRAVGNSMSHPQHHAKQTSAGHSKHAATKSKSAGGTTQPAQNASTSLVVANNVASVAPAPPAPSVAPEPTIRAAVAPAGASSRRDLPYGVPVPNKTGFVTSPYAPRAGLVDVRGFPSGTEVKDPYSGKTFLAP
jgi:hypothetical protein